MDSRHSCLKETFPRKWPHPSSAMHRPAPRPISITIYAPAERRKNFNLSAQCRLTFKCHFMFWWKYGVKRRQMGLLSGFCKGSNPFFSAKTKKKAWIHFQAFFFVISNEFPLFIVYCSFYVRIYCLQIIFFVFPFSSIFSYSGVKFGVNFGVKNTHGK